MRAICGISVETTLIKTGKGDVYLNLFDNISSPDEDGLRVSKKEDGRKKIFFFFNFHAFLQKKRASI